MFCVLCSVFCGGLRWRGTQRPSALSPSGFWVLGSVGSVGHSPSRGKVTPFGWTCALAAPRTQDTEHRRGPPGRCAPPGLPFPPRTQNTEPRQPLVYTGAPLGTTPPGHTPPPDVSRPHEPLHRVLALPIPGAHLVPRHSTPTPLPSTQHPFNPLHSLLPAPFLYPQ